MNGLGRGWQNLIFLPATQGNAVFEMLIDGKKIAEYRATGRIYFDIER
jgi:hypothetical protein